MQALSGHGILLYVLHPTDALLFVVFGIGYVNLIAAAGFVYYLLSHRTTCLASAGQRPVAAGAK